MLRSKTLKTALIGTTALVGALALDARTQIMADTVPAGVTQTSSLFLATGHSLTVQNTGSILPVNPGSAGVLVTGTTAGNISNSGVISGNAATGILVETGDGLSGGIQNSGQISGAIGINNFGTISTGNVAGTGSVSAAALFNSGSITGGITNNGTISGAASHTGVGSNGGVKASGIYNSGTINGTITNNGVISGNASHSGGGTGSVSAAGIVVKNGTINGSIVNNGTISGIGSRTSGTGNVLAAGIYVNNGLITNGITNNATISGSATNSGTGAASGVGIYLTNNSTINGGIINSGTISGSGATAATGIRIDSSSSVIGGIGNNGTISGTIGINNKGTISNSIVGAGAVSAAGIFNSSVITGGITNTGSIAALASHTGALAGKARAAGIVVNSGTINGAINNLGSISGVASRTGGTGNAQAAGIYVNNGTITNGITNQSSGTITASATNSGTGTAAGVGIYLTGFSTVNGSINNAGTISGTATGIRLDTSSTINGGITNSGQINGTIGINNAGLIKGAQGILVTGAGNIPGGITNAGTISGTATGILVAGGAVLTGTITNNGTITGGDGINVKNTSDIQGGIVNNGLVHGNNYAFDVYTNSNISGGITNNASGTISGGTTGIYVETGSSITGGIHNAGTITGGRWGIADHGDVTSITNLAGGVISGGGTGEAILVSKGNISGGIDNFGTITGPIGIKVTSSSISGGIRNEIGGVIQGTGGTAIALNNIGSTPITINGGQIIGDVTDNNPDAGNSPVTVAGTFATAGNFTVSDLILPLAGKLTISSGNTFTASQMTGGTGTLTFGVLNATPGTGFGEMVVHNAGLTGALNLSGLTVAVNATGATLAKNDQLLVGHGDTELTGTTGALGQALTTVTDNSILWNFKIADGSDTTDLLLANQTGNQDLYLIVSQGLSLGSLANTIGNTNIGNVLVNTVFTNPTLLTIQGNLNGASNATAVNNILSSAGPTVNGSDFTGSLNVSDSTQNFTDDRLASLRTGEDSSTGMAAGNMGHGTGAWGEVFGQHTDQKDRDNIAGFTANTWGAALGLDTRNVSDKAVVGLAFSYGRTDANSDNSNSTDTNVDNYEASLYGNYDFDRATYLTGMAGYTWGRVDNTRHDVGGVTGLTAHGNYDTKQISARAEAGHDYDFRGMKLTPNVMADWVNWDPDSYTETGAGGTDLHVNGHTLNRVDLGAGLKAGWSFKNSDGSWIKPQLRAGYRYAVVDDRIEDVGQFTGGGGAFSVPGPDPARSSVDLGASVKLLTTNNWTFTGSYDFDWKSDYNASAGFIRAGYKF